MSNEYGRTNVAKEVAELLNLPFEEKEELLEMEMLATTTSAKNPMRKVSLKPIFQNG